MVMSMTIVTVPQLIILAQAVLPLFLCECIATHMHPSTREVSIINNNNNRIKSNSDYDNICIPITSLGMLC